MGGHKITVSHQEKDGFRGGEKIDGHEVFLDLVPFCTEKSNYAGSTERSAPMAPFKLSAMGLSGKPLSSRSTLRYRNNWMSLDSCMSTKNHSGNQSRDINMGTRPIESIKRGNPFVGPMPEKPAGISWPAGGTPLQQSSEVKMSPQIA